MSSLPAMRTSPRFIFFTDFDGTITLRDSNDFLTDNFGFGRERRVQGNQDVLHGKMSFRESFQEMLDSVTKPFNQCIEALLENIKLDPHFLDFYEYCASENIPIVVLSGGMEPVIQALLEHLIGGKAHNIQIVSNQVKPRNGKDINEEGGWDIQYHDDSHYGHDKSLEIKPYAKLPSDIRPTLFYAGDGVSDISAAQETDLLFAKKDYDLDKYCSKHGLPAVLFRDWSTILSTVRSLSSGETTLEKIVADLQAN
ncbi:BgTH12-04830 [Blumeria graminis f. sp. triticale]|uniref:Bgt-1470 n=3 Tax=Blumeria graminis TaxID=34373 RepID=A0A9X9PR06_BLUGR|nr:hypothetical protein BGT96224_1470 [Blumeria graminis f. sp. tritici 96224]CAD6499178.1 BgTH12-04830 [Blumeria graminis f. sp. triticale]VCU39293.1 Bgt-1470 [Blumeria graminis f. sp. tritici]